MKYLARLLIIFVALNSGTAHAVACTAGEAGKSRYNAGVMEYCDASNWKPMKGSSLGSCSGNPAGKQRYSGGVMQFCDGTNWYLMKGTLIAGCTAPDAGRQRYSGALYQFCDGSNWYDMAAITSCSAGYGMSGGSCVQCTAGTYSGGGAGACANCGNDTYSGAGASGCAGCSVGQYAPPASGACANCTNLPAHADSVTYTGTGGGFNNCPYTSVACSTDYAWDGTQCICSANYMCGPTSTVYCTYQTCMANCPTQTLTDCYAY